MEENAHIDLQEDQKAFGKDGTQFNRAEELRLENRKQENQRIIICFIKTFNVKYNDILHDS